YGMLRLRRGEACLVPWFTFPSRDAGVYILRRNPIRRDEACLAPTPRQHEIANSIGSPASERDRTVRVLPASRRRSRACSCRGTRAIVPTADLRYRCGSFGDRCQWFHLVLSAPIRVLPEIGVGSAA